MSVQAEQQPVAVRALNDTHSPPVQPDEDSAKDDCASPHFLNIILL